MAENKQYCTFGISGYTFGAAADSVQEIVTNNTITPVPLAPPDISGLLNVRGQIVTAINLRRRLGITNSDSKTGVHILVRGGDSTVSLFADLVEDVMDINSADVEPVPDTVDPSIKAFVDGVYKTNDKLILLLNVNKAVMTE
ncbi:MAG: chemotaxis protein CheW [Verrucomicrobiia bacterium]